MRTYKHLAPHTYKGFIADQEAENPLKTSPHTYKGFIADQEAENPLKTSIYSFQS